ncbi:hypothetical protein [Capnocytophaga gingivalis]|uniref:hypothetical protein n=1 Tax=Capnocytophaga gingivalis TaxID=1017 RepID=UPI003C73037F
MASEKVRYFRSRSRLWEDAKLGGLTYNAFFIFVGAAVLIFTPSVLIGGAIGGAIGALIVAFIYAFLFFIQNKLGTRELWKRINYFYNPIDYIKVSTNMRRFLKAKKEESLKETKN